MTNIKYFGFAKEGASVPVLGLILNKNEYQQGKCQLSKVLGQINNLELKADQRQRIKSQHGSWYCKKDSRGLTYLTLCNSSYPERHIYAAINQVKEHLQKLDDYQTQPDSTLKLHCNQTIQEICKNYENIQTFDKLSIASSNLQDVKSDVRKNTSLIIGNMVNMQSLQNKSQRMKGIFALNKENALLFQNTAGELQQIMYWRSIKIKVIIGIVIVALLLLIIVPIATQQTN